MKKFICWIGLHKQRTVPACAANEGNHTYCVCYECAWCGVPLGSWSLV